MKQVYLALLTTISIAGCSTQPVSTAAASAVQAKRWAEPLPGDGVLTIKRDSGLMGAACSAGVYVDGEHVADLRPSQKVTVYLTPGEHMVGARNGSICGGAVSEASLVLGAEMKKTYRIAIGDAGALHIQPTAF